MKTKTSWRRGFGLGQIMATLLVVLPTMAFSIMFLISYWNVMQIDYKLKLIADIASEYASNKENLSDFSGTDFSDFSTQASQLCPQGKAITFGTPTYTGPKDIISITVEYTTPASDVYLANKKLSTNIQTYSYHEQNMSVVLTCPTI